MAKIAEQPQTVTLDQVLEMASKLPAEQQDRLAFLLERHRIEDRREEILQGAIKARAAFERGELKPQTVAEIMESLK
jgi:hypothetical protein